MLGRHRPQGNQINGDVHTYNGSQGDPSTTLGAQTQIAGIAAVT